MPSNFGDVSERSGLERKKERKAKRMETSGDGDNIEKRSSEEKEKGVTVRVKEASKARQGKVRVRPS